MTASRPGVITYFTNRAAINRLTDEQAGKLYKATLAYAQDGFIPEFPDDLLLQILWDVIMPQIDADGITYTSKVESGNYAAYCKKAKRAGVEAVPYAVWVAFPPEDREKLLI